MPKMDFTNVPDADDFSPVPEGQYLARLQEIDDTRTTIAGDEKWGLRWFICKDSEGGIDQQGRLVFDNMVFNGNDVALKRIKLICSRLGIDVSGEVDLTPDLLLGKFAWIDVYTDEHVDKTTGKSKQTSRIQFAGYETPAAEHYADLPEDIGLAADTEGEDEEEAPF